MIWKYDIITFQNFNELGRAECKFVFIPLQVHLGHDNIGETPENINMYHIIQRNRITSGCSFFALWPI